MYRNKRMENGPPCSGGVLHGAGDVVETFVHRNFFLGSFLVRRVLVVGLLFLAGDVPVVAIFARTLVALKSLKYPQVDDSGTKLSAGSVRELTGKKCERTLSGLEQWNPRASSSREPRRGRAPSSAARAAASRSAPASASSCPRPRPSRTSKQSRGDDDSAGSVEAEEDGDRPEENDGAAQNFEGKLSDSAAQRVLFPRERFIFFSNLQFRLSHLLSLRSRTSSSKRFTY